MCGHCFSCLGRNPTHDFNLGKLHVTKVESRWALFFCKFEFCKGENKGCCPLILWFTLSYVDKMFRTFCINRDQFLSHLIITLPLVRGYLAEICTLLGKFSLSLLVTFSCYGLSLLLVEEVMCYLSWSTFLALWWIFLG
jgi:hypothetical protein